MLFTSSLGTEYREALEELLFFNPGQASALGAIMDALEAFGAPELYVEAERLRVKVGALAEVQSLFALDGERLAGVLVYARSGLERLVVLHIAVAGEYSARGPRADQFLVMRLIETLRRSARRIKGVEWISLAYGARGSRDLRVGSAAPKT